MEQKYAQVVEYTTPFSAEIEADQDLLILELLHINIAKGKPINCWTTKILVKGIPGLGIRNTQKIGVLSKKKNEIYMKLGNGIE